MIKTPTPPRPPAPVSIPKALLSLQASVSLQQVAALATAVSTIHIQWIFNLTLKLDVLTRCSPGKLSPATPTTAVPTTWRSGHVPPTLLPQPRAPATVDSSQARFEYMVKLIESATQHHAQLDKLSKTVSAALLWPAIRDLSQMSQVMQASLGLSPPESVTGAAPATPVTAETPSARQQGWQNSASMLAWIGSSALVKLLKQVKPNLSTWMQLVTAGGAFVVTDKLARQGADQLYQAVHTPTATSAHPAPNRIEQVIDGVATAIQVAGVVTVIKSIGSALVSLVTKLPQLRGAQRQVMLRLGQSMSSGLQGVMTGVMGLLGAAGGHVRQLFGWLPGRVGTFIASLRPGLSGLRAAIAGLMMLGTLMAGALAPWLPVIAGIAAVGATLVVAVKHAEGIKNFFGFGDELSAADTQLSPVTQVKEISDQVSPSPLLQQLSEKLPLLEQGMSPLVVPAVTPALTPATAWPPLGASPAPGSAMAPAPSVVIENIHVQTPTALTSAESEGLQQRIQAAIQDFFMEQQTAARGDYLCSMA